MISLIQFLNNYKKLIIVVAILKWMAFHVWIINSWFGLSFEVSVWDSVVSNVTLVALSLVLNNVLKNYLPVSGKFWYALGLSFALSWLCHWGVTEGLKQVGTHDTAYLFFLMKSAPIRWVIDFLVVAGVSVSSVFYTQMLEQQELSRREATTTSMVKEAELQKLQLQLQPHFLFNSLNSISALILSNPKEARKMLQSLSDFLRSTIKKADEHWVSLGEEFNHLELYLEIEKIRFGHRLNVEADLHPSTLEWNIPTLVLQPLVENAIKFGLYGTTDTVRIKITSELNNQLVQVTITNPFDPEMAPKKGSGFGLSGIKRRLYLLFARNDLLEIVIIENTFSVTLKIPARNDQNITY